ncbi:MAG: ABC transporter ATP-binding protein [Methylococcaceae bacterium]|jgi:sulfonate transport system ATP-binding protein
MTALQINIIRKYFPDHGKAGGKTVIEALHLTVQHGEFVCLVGPSGCGKTSLLNLLAGLDTDFEGTIDAGMPNGKPPRLGYVFQNPRLLPWRTVDQNIQLALPEDHDPAYIDHLFARVGLSEARSVYPERLSVGMSRRAALVRAFAIQPEILLMDEPFVSLDPPTGRRMRELLLSLWLEQSQTVLFVTHDLREAIELGDRLIFLSASPSRVICDIGIDTPQALRDGAMIENFRLGLEQNYPAIASLL